MEVSETKEAALHLTQILDDARQISLQLLV
jgi:hypothetical protein